MRPLVLLVPALLLFAGCLRPDGTPEERALRAWDDFAASLLGEGGGMAKMEGNVSSGQYAASLLFEVARDGTRHAKIAVSGFSFEYYCQGERAARVIGEDVYEMRPGECPLDGLGERSMKDLAGQVRVVNATAEGNEVVAQLEPANQTTRDEDAVGGITIRVDRRDHVEHVEMTSPGGNLVADVTYGGRDSWKMPATTKRLPANVEGDDDFDTHDGVGTFEWQADDVNSNVSLSEIEIRVMDPASNRTVATFRPSANETQAGFAFVFDDEDGDGMLSEDDRFTITKEGWRRGEHVVEVWDTWADAKLERRIPAAGIAIPIVAFAIVAFLRRR